MANTLRNVDITFGEDGIRMRRAALEKGAGSYATRNRRPSEEVYRNDIYFAPKRKLMPAVARRLLWLVSFPVTELGIRAR